MEQTGKTAREAARLFQELIEHWEAADAAARQRLSLNVTDFKALKVLCERGPLGPGELAGILHISTATTTGVVDRLEAHGYVTRTLHPTDRRRSSVTVNDALIQDPLAPAHALLSDVDAVLAHRPQPEREQILACLRELSDRMRHTIAQFPAPSHHPAK